MDLPSEASTTQVAVRLAAHPGELRLEPGSRVGVIGGGPAGSLFAHFLLELCGRAELPIEVDVYEPHDYARPGPASCNHCGGIVSESLVQLLAAEGINLPGNVVQRGLDSYVLHMQGESSRRIEAPGFEKRIAAVQRGAGPRGMQEVRWKSFDGFLQELTRRRGVRIVPERVSSVSWSGDRPCVHTRAEGERSYDLLTVAVGVNSALSRNLEALGVGYRPPRTTRTYISEFYLGQETVEHYLGSSMHVFLLDVPRLEFSALVPKGDHVTLCLLGEEIDTQLVEQFVARPEVRECFPPGWTLPETFCHCAPRMNVGDAIRPWADRVVFIGDAGVSRLYKDGIGAAYRTAKAAAVTAALHGISEGDFARHYGPTCRRLSRDNRLGQLVFGLTAVVKKLAPARRAVVRMVDTEQARAGVEPRMSSVLWDTFTGSAPYRDILRRSLHPALVGRLVWNTARGLLPLGEPSAPRSVAMKSAMLGKTVRPGEVLVREGEVGDQMFVIQSGEAEVLRGSGDTERRLAVLGPGDFFGEMALFGREVRSATVRALGEAQVLSVDKRTFLRRISEDPALALRVTEKMAQRIRQLNTDVDRLEASVRELRQRPVDGMPPLA